LVIFRAERHHHQAEDVQESADQKQPARTVTVEQSADDGSLSRVSSPVSYIDDFQWRIIHTQRNMTKVSTDEIQATVLGEY
jgi:hypothetical protein